MTEHRPIERSAQVAPVLDQSQIVALATERRTVIADVRWYLDGRDGRAAYESSHVPGAVFVDLEEHLARHDLAPTEGRHPLPTPDAFAASMIALGIDDDTLVVAYDDAGGITAGRLVVMLRMLGRDAAVLDGGLLAWEGPLETGPGRPDPPAPGRFTVTPWPDDRLATADEVVRSPGADGISIDARSYERFTGAVTQIDPRPGHIPGARSAPWDAVIDPATKRFRSPDELAAHFAGLGITPSLAGEDVDVIAYCGSGVSACMNVIAMERAGLQPPRLYVASFSGWSADGDRPIAVGDE